VWRYVLFSALFSLLIELFYCFEPNGAKVLKLAKLRSTSAHICLILAVVYTLVCAIGSCIYHSMLMMTSLPFQDLAVHVLFEMWDRY
jgi:hypothetical protein